MKRQAHSILSLLLAVMAVMWRAHGQEMKQGEILQISNVTKPIEEAAKETKVLSIFLKDSDAKYKEASETIERYERDYKSAIASAKTEDTKRELTLDYLGKRISFIDRMLEDLSFVSSKMTEKAGGLNILIGQFGEKSAMLEKAEAAAASTGVTIEKIEALKREARVLKSESPKQGTPEYMEWFRKQVQLQVNFTKETGELRRSVKQAVWYEQLSKCLKITKEDAQQWQSFVLLQTLAFSEAQQDLVNEKQLAQDCLDFVKATSAFGELKPFGEFAENFKGAVSKVSQTGLPDPLEIGGMAGADPPVIKLDSLDAMLSFDPQKYLEDAKKKSPLKTVEQPKPKE